MALTLNITLDSTPEAFQSIPISLRWEHDDPLDFVLGAFSNFPGINLVMIVTANQVVEDFTEDRIVDMTFNYTSPSRDDCTLIAWLQAPDIDSEPRNNFAVSEPFTVKTAKHTSTSITIKPTIPTTVSGTASSVSGGIPSSTTVSNIQPKPTSRTGAVVGGVLCLLAVGCIASCTYVFIRRRKSKGPTLIALLLKSSNTSFPQEHETQALPEVMRARLEEETARMREEITALMNQIGRMEAGYRCSPPPSYRSASNYSSSNVSNSSRSFRV
ncbi:hypothetical protein ARMSODRAFT_1087867 [Armillaria solidipes]|uniref:Uncharacterized protein n=1 Tax=Armillaria solidipes TaxID=1076256 RepID=A0A2H3BEG2_9AGAR|nr:hypothetical protein ARMSODRAFT_1087867 [Armillaria solidipes]